MIPAAYTSLRASASPVATCSGERYATVPMIIPAVLAPACALAVAQRAAVHQFHDEEQQRSVATQAGADAAGVLALVVNVDDGGVVDAGGGAGLALEPVAEGGVGGQ